MEPGKTTSYTYDRLGRLTDEQVSDGNRWSYTFDAFGNRKTLTFTGAAPYAVTYHYNLCNQLISEVRTGAGADTKTYTYDNNGNQTTCIGTAGPLEYRWYNGFDQLVDMSSITAREKYLYRPDDTRHCKASNSDEGYSEVYHVWDQGSIVVDFTFGAGPYTTTLYQRGTGLLAREVSGVRQYYLHNGHGDVVQMVDGAGNVAVRYDYDAFGNLAAPVAGDLNPFRYCGEYFDKGSETYYLRARYYNPRIGRFTSEDVARDGLNWYTYCGNNPIAYVDPLGLVRMDTSSLLEELGVSGKEKDGRIHTIINGTSYDFSKRMDSADFAKQIGLNNRFGSHDSDITTDQASLFIRSEYANAKLNDPQNYFARTLADLNSVVLNPEKHYLLDFNGSTIQLQMTRDTMHVNMAEGDGGKLSLGYDTRLELAMWLKDIYARQYKTEFAVDALAIGEELWAHAAAYSAFGSVPYVGPHARVADIGVAGAELWHERVLWDALGKRRQAGPIMHNPVMPIPGR